MRIQRLWIFLSLLLLLPIFMGLPALSNAQQGCQPDGDVDRSGSVTAADALLAFQQALGLAQLDVCQQSIADVSSDGIITASDALCIFQKALSLPSCLDTLPSSNQPPVADAGPDQVANENDRVTLSGAGSDLDGTIVTYHWVQTSGTLVTLSGADTQNASFTAPEIASEDVLVEKLEFQLTVTDDDGASATDTVVVSVAYGHLFVDNDPPTADAGPDQTVDENTLVTLSGSGTDPDGFIVHYEWLQTDGTTVLLIGADTPNPSFTAPDVNFDEALVFRLTVYDDDSALATDSVTITVVEPAIEPQPPGEQHALDVSVFGEGDIQVQATGGQLDCAEITMCRGTFNQGDEIVLIAEPDSGWTHESWIGCDRQDLLGRCTVFMDGDRLVSVTFLSADPLELDDSVVVLRDDQLQGLIEYDLDTGRFVFDAATSDISQLVVGTIVLAAEDPNEGITIARRITGIERNGSQVVFSTEQASLEEIFRSGSFSYQGDAGYGDTDEADADSETLQYPDPIAAQSEDEGTRIPINIELGSGVMAGGWITFPMEYDFAFNASPLEFRVLATAEPTASVGLEISGSVMVSDDRELLSKRLGTIWIVVPLPTPLGIVPVRIPVYPTLKVILEGVAEASASVGMGAEISVNATAGVHYKDGNLTPVFEADLDPMYRVSSGLDFDLSWNVEVRARGELHFSLLKVAGPYVGVVPYYGMSSGCGDSLAETYKGWRLEVGGNFFTAIGGPRLALPVYDSSPEEQEPIPLSRMPSDNNRCREMPEPMPSPPGGQHGSPCISGNSIQHALVDGYAANGHEIAHIAPAPDVSGLAPGSYPEYNSNGQRHGRTLDVRSSGGVKVTHYDNGSLVATCGTYDSAGKPGGGFCNYVRGQEDGVCYNFSYINESWRFSTYRDGVWHGPFGGYNSEGKPHGAFGNYVDGHADGVWYDFSRSGWWDFRTYRNSTLHGPAGTYTSEGKPSDLGNYADGQRDGIWYHYYNTGAWKFITYRAGTAHGPYGRHNAQGQKHGCFGSYTDGNRNPEQVCYSNGVPQ